MRVVAVKRTGRKDRFYCTRPDGSEVSWAAASAPGLPHDLHHLVVESLAGLDRGFWGLVRDGMEPAAVDAVTRAFGAGRDDVRGDGLADLRGAEAAVACLLGPMAPPGVSDAERFAVLDGHLRTQGLGVPAGLDVAAVGAIRRRAAALAARWEALAPGIGTELAYPLPPAPPVG